MMKYTNAIHNILNVVVWTFGALGAVAAYAGCITTPNGAFDCSASTIVPPSWIPTILAVTTAAGVIKTALNLKRDGLTGLTKEQPPVKK